MISLRVALYWTELLLVSAKKSLGDNIIKTVVRFTGKINFEMDMD
jgi:hypothetical protein